jgi:hypothetical protein
MAGLPPDELSHKCRPPQSQNGLPFPFSTSLKTNHEKLTANACLFYLPAPSFLLFPLLFALKQSFNHSLYDGIIKQRANTKIKEFNNNLVPAPDLAFPHA